MTETPHRRRSDSLLVRYREWWLLVITLIVFAALGLYQHHLSDVQDRQAVQQAQIVANQTHIAVVQATQRAQITAQHRALLASCARGNVKTRAANTDALADYVFFNAVLQRAIISSRALPAATQKAGAKYLLLFKASVHQKTWVPPTDCVASVAQAGAGYTNPSPVLFVMRRPPTSALTPTTLTHG